MRSSDSSGHVPDPERARRGLQGVVDQRQEVGAHRVEIDLLTEAYAEARGDIESSAVRDERGAVQPFSAWLQAAEGVAARAVHVVLRIVGLGVRDFFALEEGVHVWTSLDREPQIVRVRVFPADLTSTPASVIAEHVEAQRAYDEAAREGRPLPADPSALAPVARKLRFDPPRAGRVTSPIEDYAMGFAETVEARGLADALAPIWLLRTSRVDLDLDARGDE